MVTIGPITIKKLAVHKVHGRWVLQIGMNGAATVKFTLKRLHPHKATIKHFKRTVGNGSNKITLQPLAKATYTVAVTIVSSRPGTATAKSRSITFTVK